jgi:hypothetical protein
MHVHDRQDERSGRCQFVINEFAGGGSRYQHWVIVRCNATDAEESFSPSDRLREDQQTVLL